MVVDEGASGRKEIKVDYPANSHMVRPTEKREQREKKVNKIIKGKVVKRKKTFKEKLAETFFSVDVGSVSSYIIYDVLIPAAKDTIEDLVKGSIEVLIRGESRGSHTRRDKGKSYVSYSNYYNRSRDDRRDDRRDTSARNRARHNFEDIILDSRGEAEEVLSHLVDLTEDYGVASVADLYDLVGMTGNFTDNKYGWTNLSDATVSRVRDGYIIDLPKTIQTD